MFKIKGKEYQLCTLVLLVVLITYAYAFYTLNSFFSLIVGIFSSLLGAFMIPFGFWGADFAFGVSNGDVRQQKEKGLIKGTKGEVYVPFVKNYTPLEWWNISWFIVSVGVGLLCIGTFVIGYSLHTLL